MYICIFNSLTLKILILRFSSIGDIVLTSPVVRCLKQQLIGAEIHFLTKEPFKEILLNNPHINRVFSFQSNVKEVLKKLKAEKYDLIIDLHHNLRSLRVKRALATPAVSFNKLNWQKWLKVNFKLDHLPRVHIVERYLAAVKHLGVKDDGKGLDFFISPKDHVAIKSAYPKLQSGFYALVIGGSYYTKQIPLNKLEEICQLSPRPLVLLGGKDDARLAEKLALQFPGKVMNACGKYNLHQSASFLQQADKVISSDTGLMHIAAAFKKNIVSIWGNTIPEFGMYPYLPGPKSKILEVKNLSCRPCSKLGYASCPKGHFRCMKDIEVKEVFE